MSRDFEELSHTADLAMRVYGDTFEHMLSHAIIGMFQLLRPRIPGATVAHGRVIAPALPVTRDVEVTGVDYESALVDLLSEVWTLSDMYDEAYLQATVTHRGGYSYVAHLNGTHIEGFENGEIKAVTYHQLEVIYEPSLGWSADIVFDI